jgi:hypothetical protein
LGFALFHSLKVEIVLGSAFGEAAGDAFDKAMLQQHEEHPDRQNDNDCGHHYLPPVRAVLARDEEDRHHRRVTSTAFRRKVVAIRSSLPE